MGGRRGFGESVTKDSLRKSIEIKKKELAELQEKLIMLEAPERVLTTDNKEAGIGSTVYFFIESDKDNPNHPWLIVIRKGKIHDILSKAFIEIYSPESWGIDKYQVNIENPDLSIAGSCPLNRVYVDFSQARHDAQVYLEFQYNKIERKAKCLRKQLDNMKNLKESNLINSLV